MMIEMHFNFCMWLKWSKYLKQAHSLRNSKNGSVSKKIVLKKIYLFIVGLACFLSLFLSIFLSFFRFFLLFFLSFFLFSLLIFSISFLFSSYSEFIQGLHQPNSEQTYVRSLHTSCTFQIFYCRWMQLSHKNIKSFHPRSIMYTFHPNILVTLHNAHSLCLLYLVVIFL